MTDTGLFKEDPALDGVIDRAELTGKKYSLPKYAGTEADWEVTLTLRLIVEGAGL
jgi:hypothetical protein